jgi:adrenodoxin-NADP+ reductase
MVKTSPNVRIESPHVESVKENVILRKFAFDTSEENDILGPKSFANLFPVVQVRIGLQHSTSAESQSLSVCSTIETLKLFDTMLKAATGRACQTAGAILTPRSGFRGGAIVTGLSPSGHRNALLGLLIRPFSFSATTEGGKPFHVAVVGTGPGGFYTSKYLLKEDPSIHVDLIDALPTPFGLVRSGVAPDHPEVKAVQNDFEEVASDPRVSFLGNVRIGSDVQVSDLRQLYDAVVLAYGAASDRYLNIPGENFRNVFSARAFVNWYNGHPEFTSFKPNLDATDVVIIGHGNVAIDCARILCKTVEELKKTDIATHALEALSKSRVRRVHVVGRRGHVQASFTMKELREVTKLEDADVIVRPAELATSRTPASLEEMEEHRARKRMDALLTEVASQPLKGASRQLHLRFLLTPRDIAPNGADEPAAPSSGGEQQQPQPSCGAVHFEVSRLEGAANHQKAVSTGNIELIPAGMVLRSVGYKSIRVPGVPFDETRAVVRNDRGRVMEDDNTTPFKGVYVSGWLKRGPSGIIGTNIPCAKETATMMLEDKEQGKIGGSGSDGKPGGGVSPLERLKELLISRGKPAEHLISWTDYRTIDQAEREKGAAQGRPREKITDLQEMLAIAAAKHKKDKEEKEQEHQGASEGQEVDQKQ